MNTDTSDNITAAETPVKAEDIQTAEENATADTAVAESVTGVSDVFDIYEREILENTFENILTMAKNPVKLNYSAIKNAIMSYKNVKCGFFGGEERFFKGKKIIFRLKCNTTQLLLYLSLDGLTLDRKAFPRRDAKEYEDTNIFFTVNPPPSRKRALEAVRLVAEKEGLQLLKSFTYIPYAENYPVNINAVLKGKEHIPPKDNEFSGKGYEIIYNETTAQLLFNKSRSRSPEKKTGKEKLKDIRQEAKTLKGAVAIAEPIAYYYDAAVDRESKPLYINVQQVLNDRFLGKLVPEQYFAVAEASERIEQLNILALKAVTQDCDMRPDKDFCLNVSCRMLIKKDTLEKLIKNSKTEHKNLILSFDCRLLDTLGDSGGKGIAALKENGVKIMLDNSEQASMRVLTEYYIDYLRFDGRYYSEDKINAVHHLDLMTAFAKKLGIPTTAKYIDTTRQAVFMFTHGVGAVQGFAVSEPRRLVNAAIKEIKKLPLTGG